MLSSILQTGLLDDPKIDEEDLVRSYEQRFQIHFSYPF